MKKVAFLFPGQGSQYVGMGKDFYNGFACFQDVFKEAEETLSYHLSRLVFEGPIKDLTATHHSQIAIYVFSLGICRVLKEQFPELEPCVCAGLSLGEYSALTRAGYLTYADGIDLVRSRGLYMHEASLDFPGTMSVCLGLDVKSVKEVLADLGPDSQVWIANLNCPQQVVISGSLEGIQKANALLKEGGAKRLLPLDVSGAFHSGLMEEARQKLEAKIKTVPFKQGSCPVVLNVCGDYIDDPLFMSRLLVDQVVSPVYWEKGIRRIVEQEIDLFVELGCGKTLTGLNRKIGVQAPTISCEKTSDLFILEKQLSFAKVS